jgi:hypothetical protein
MPNSRLFDWLVTALALVLPVVVFFEVTGSLADQDAASGGPMRDAAYVPRLLGWAILFLAAAHAVKLAFTRAASAEPGPRAPAARTGLALLASAAFVAYLLLLPLAGYYIATPILLAGLMRLFGLGWIGSLASALVYTLVVAWVFEGLLNVILPLGWFEFTLFG